MTISFRAKDDLGSNPTGSSTNVTVTSTNAGDMMAVFVTFRSSSTVTVSSITNASSDVFASANARSSNTTQGRGYEIWYCGSLSAGVTQITLNFSASATVAVQTITFSTDSGNPFALDGGAGLTNASIAGTPENGASATVTTAGVGVAGMNSGGSSSTGFTGGTTYDDANGNKFGYIIGTSASSFTPQWNGVSAATWVTSTATFYENAGTALMGQICV